MELELLLINKTKSFYLIVALSLISVFANVNIVYAQGTIRPRGQAVYSWLISTMKQVPQPAFASYDIRFDVHGLWLQIWCGYTGIEPTVVKPTLVPDQSISGTWHVVFRSSDGAALVKVVKLGIGTVAPPTRGGVSCRPFPYAATWAAVRKAGNNVVQRSPGITPRISSSPADEARVGAITKRSPFTTIATVTAYVNVHYRIQNIGINDRRGIPVYHLKLTALGDPSKYPITDIYVGVRNHRIYAITFGGGQRGLIEGGGGSATFTFGPVGPYWLLTGGTVTASGHFLVLHEGGAYTFVITYTGFPKRLPASGFTPYR